MPEDKEPPVEPVEIRRNPEDPKQAAYKTGPTVTAGDWYVFKESHGGSYTDGVAEGVEDWTVVK